MGGGTLQATSSSFRMDTSGPSGSIKTGPSGLKSASKALSVSFGDDHAMDNMRGRIAARKKKRQNAEKLELERKGLERHEKSLVVPIGLSIGLSIGR